MAGRSWLMLGQLQVVCGEEGARADALADVLQRSAGDGQTIGGAGAPANFIQDEQGAGGGLVQDGGGLHHLGHERGVPARQVILRADAREDAVHQANAGVRRRHPGADLRQ